MFLHYLHGYWHFLLFSPDLDPVKRLPDIWNQAYAGYPEFGHVSDKIPITGVHENNFSGNLKRVVPQNMMPP